MDFAMFFSLHVCETLTNKWFAFFILPLLSFSPLHFSQLLFKASLRSNKLSDLIAVCGRRFVFRRASKWSPTKLHFFYSKLGDSCKRTVLFFMRRTVLNHPRSTTSLKAVSDNFVTWMIRPSVLDSRVSSRQFTMSKRELKMA